MRNRMKLKGSTALITGAASGIGFATAKNLARRGAGIVLVDVNDAALERARAELTAEGFASRPCTLDITDDKAVTVLRDELASEGMVPEILVNCAGVTLVAHVRETARQDWDRIIGVNVMGTINIIEAFLPALLERKSGHIVNVGSIDGLLPIPSQAAYCASKFAITGLTEVLYFDLRKCGIGVTLICPGMVSTPMAAAIPIRGLPTEFRGSGMVMRLVEAISKTPERIAAHIVEAIEQKRFLVIPGWPSRAFYRFRRSFPRSATSLGVRVASAFESVQRRAAAIPERIPA